jgi:hypothetical protein
MNNIKEQIYKISSKTNEIKDITNNLYDLYNKSLTQNVNTFNASIKSNNVIIDDSLDYINPPSFNFEQHCSNQFSNYYPNYTNHINQHLNQYDNSNVSKKTYKDILCENPNYFTSDNANIYDNIIPKFSVTYNGSWVTITAPWNDINLDNSNSVDQLNELPSIKLLNVENANQLNQLPSGILCYRLDLKKISLSSQTHDHSISVPLGCKMWDVNDPTTLVKYARFNPGLKHKDYNKYVNPSTFYIDNIVSKIINIPEDTSRSFRPIAQYKWNGHNIYGMHNFGDARYLKEHSTLEFDDAIDLYQYCLWMILVCIHHKDNSPKLTN